MARRVVITGIGCVTPLGSRPDALWDNLVAGRSGVGPLTLFDAGNFPVRIAAEVRGWDVAQLGEHADRWRTAPRQTQFAIGAARQAVAASGLIESQIDPRRLGVYLGCGECFGDFLGFTRLLSQALRDGDLDRARFMREAFRLWRSEEQWEQEPHLPAAHIAGLFDAQGPNLNCIAACASATQAIGEAGEIIRRGDADAMICGGAHSMIHPFGITGLDRLEALSRHNDNPPAAVRPFDRTRDGFVVGEGGAILVLEELERARRRGADIWGELTGYGSAQDAFRITDSHPEGRGAASCMAQALASARMNPEQVDYINAHGTGTVVNDKVETAAIKRVFGAQARRVPISSTKSMIGHLTTAGGAVELAICLLVLRHGAVPPTINYNERDPECDLDYVPNQARQVRCRHILSNSFGFGGQNAALVVSHAGAANRFAA